MNDTLKRAEAEFRSAFWVLGGLSFATNLLVLTTPLYMLQIYDRVLGSGSLETLTFLSIIAFAAILTMGALETLRSIISQRVAARLDLRLSEDALNIAMDGQGSSNGDLQPLRDMASIRNFIASPALFALMDLPFAPVFLIALTILQPFLGLLTLCGIIVLALVAYINQAATDSYGNMSAKKSMGALSAAQIFVRNSEVIKALGMRGNAVGRWGKLHGESLNALDGAGKLGGMFMGASKTMRIILQMAVLGVGALLVLNGYMTAGMIFAASLISGRALQPIDQVIASWRNITHARTAWARLREPLSQLSGRSQTLELPALEGGIELENATYFHTKPDGSRSSEPLLRRISFNVDPGDSIAIIGPSGAGKTTLLRLLVGAVEASQGTVRFDGSDIKQYGLDTLGRQLGYLPQEIELMPGTIAENIARLDDDPKSDAIINAAKMANAHDMIQRLPDGYDTVLGQEGMTLSGGQRQRIGLARAFYGDPKILLLDEPNANLDSEGEEALASALAAAKSEKISVLMVTQRMSALRHVGKVLHLQNGMVDRFEDRSNLVARLVEEKERMEAKKLFNQGKSSSKPKTAKSQNQAAAS